MIILDYLFKYILGINEPIGNKNPVNKISLNGKYILNYI